MSYKQELKLNNQDLQEQINKVSSLSYDENLVLPLGIQSKLISLLQNSIDEKTKGYIPPVSTFGLNRSSNIQTGTLNASIGGGFHLLLVPVLIDDEIVWRECPAWGGIIEDVVYNKLIIAIGDGYLEQDSHYGVNILYSGCNDMNYQPITYCFLTLIGHDGQMEDNGYFYFADGMSGPEDM